MATQLILSKLTNLVIPDDIIFDIDKMVYHAKHAVYHKKVMDQLILIFDVIDKFDTQIFECINISNSHEKEIKEWKKYNKWGSELS